MGNQPHTLPVRADWYQLIMKHLFANVRRGEIRLNKFAEEKLNIDPDDIKAGKELDKILQGMEDLHIIFYDVTEKVENGKQKQSLNNVEYIAYLQPNGLQVMSDFTRNKQITNLTIASIIIALVSAIGSIGAVIVASNDNTDAELQLLNTKQQTQVQILQRMQQSQTGIDASLRHIKDSVIYSP